MIQRRSLFLFLLALAFGAAAAWVAYVRVAAPDDAGDRAGIETRSVVVAAFDIEQGDVVERAALRKAAWPTDSVPDGALLEYEQAEGRFASQGILRGEPLTDKRVVDNLGGSTLAHLIEPNKRALTVRVNDVIGVAGFLLPGNRVDVLATRMEDRSRNRAETRTLLESLKVLAVDQKSQANADDPVLVRAVTLEVDPEQAESLVQATEEGTVQLVLRNPKDELRLADAEDKTPEKPAVKRVYVPRPGPDVSAVTVIRGTTADVSKTRF